MAVQCRDRFTLRPAMCIDGHGGSDRRKKGGILGPSQRSARGRREILEGSKAGCEGFFFQDSSKQGTSLKRDVQKQRAMSSCSERARKLWTLSL